MKKLFLLFLLVPLISCSDHQTNNSWGSYATNKETQKQEFWFISYKTREECIADMSWQLEGEDDPNKKRISILHTKPYGCHFMSNNKWLSMYYYLVYKDKDLGCLWESSNPNVQIKYSVTLKTFVIAPEQGRCILGD
jgi:hypothetical protein|uniref:Uncharacterized protein n=1 Tax=uncultured marine bacterium 580 TaxID=257400 RepID=Q6SFN7_9BACT|nr:hypothetical protein MBMO_EBAC000-36A07.20 [uncultured marine bacterium 580]